MMLAPKQEENLDIQPILRWAGSKKAILNKLEEHLPQKYTKYIELFSGSACLFFKLNPQKAVISDSNKDLINFYKKFSRHPREIYDQFISIPRTDHTYYKIRKKMEVESNSLTRAAYFLYLNRNCFNGIYRTNSNGHFNVPFSSSRIAGYPDKETLIESASALKNADILCGDFESIALKTIIKDSIVYLDPPYYVPNQRVFREYSGKPFTEQDFERLAALLKKIDKKQAKFMLSYPDCSLSNALAKEWNSSRILVKRIIGGTQSSRKNKYERIIKNY